MANAIKIFKTDIQNGPTYICTICNRLLYRTSVKIFCRNEDESILNWCTNKLSHDNVEYICSLCQKSLKANRLPPLAVKNGLELDEVPHEIDELNSLEAVFISRRIPFMKILALPRGKQKAVHGCVVNVPIEPEQVASILPRVPSTETFIKVKVKRKLMYRGHSYMSTIRPDKIRNALHILKNQLQNPLYQDVLVNENWIEDSSNTDPELWDSLVGPNQPSNNTSDDQMSEGESDSKEEEDEDNRSKLNGLPYDKCIQPKDTVTENVLSIAPGEGKKPLSFSQDTSSEELSFPQLFPTGRFGMSYKRSTKLSLKKYFQARLLNCDGRFAKNIDYIFYAQYRAEVKEVYDSISLSLRKGKQQDLTAGDLKERVADFIRSDLGIHFMQKIRGSPAFYNKMFYDLLGMIRQLGPCTMFVTLSAADLKWTDTIKIIARQNGREVKDEEIEALSWEEKCQYLRSNPITAARHFSHRVNMLFKQILLNKQLNPLGEVADYKYRIEFQQRGSPHLHMLVWVKDAPSVEFSDISEIKRYIDNTISCELPESDSDLLDLVSLLQKHTHSVACRKHGTTCRFRFPRPPLNETLVLKPLEDQPPSEMKDIYSAALTSVYDQLEDVDNETTLQDVLKAANVSEQLYLEALHWVKTKGGQPAVLLKRKPSEVNINNYNSTLLKAWEANLDVQFVTNVYQCVMYVASYVSKPEKTLGEVLKSVSASSQHLGTKQSMKNVANKFLIHREVSAQEAVYRLLSLPLTSGSREVLFVPTDMHEDRTRLFKPLATLQSMEDDDDDVYLKNLLDRYAARPNSLDDTCLAEFATNYKTSYTPPKPEDTNEVDDLEEVDQPAQKITLKDGLGYMTKRKTPAIIRTHQWSVKKQPENYVHSQLLLYFPWRDEQNDLFQESYKNSYELKCDTILQNRQYYEHHGDEVADMLEDIDEYGFPDDDNWVTVAPQTEQARLEEEREGPQVEPSIHGAFDTETHNTTATDAGVVPHEYTPSTEDVSDIDWKTMILSLNNYQYQLHQFIVNWATSMLLSHTGQKPKPFHIFLTGGAGVGKSFLVRTIVQTVKRLFQRDNQINDTHILVCAPTGAAAYNIAGHTCHSIFQLPIRSRRDDDYIPLARERLANMKETVGNTKLIIIDEVSMLSADMLFTIHRRLCDIMGNDQPFGGVSILAVGDLMQLPPVAQKAVYCPPSDEMAAIYGSLWTNLFQIVELTEIERQKNDVIFAQLLNRVRVGDHTDQDITLLQSRTVTDSNERYPLNSTHMYTMNKLKDAHNSCMLENLNDQVFSFKANDSKVDQQTKRVIVTTFETQAGGLHSQLNIAIGARVVLMKNIDVSDGLVNSATGIVTGFIPRWNADLDLKTYKPKYILVRFHDERVGIKARSNSRGLLPEHTSTPISTVEVPVYLSKRSSKVTCKRTQFPLSLAWGVTIHKEQGKTEDMAVICTDGRFCSGQFYTAISRLRDLGGLYFIGEVSGSKIKVNQDSLKEVNRMKQDKLFHPSVPESLSKSRAVYVKMQLFNINSIRPHLDCYLKDPTLQDHHIICIQETWLTSNDSTPNIDKFQIIRCDHPKIVNRHRQGGLLMYIHEDFRMLRQYQLPDNHIEHQIFLLSHTQDENMRITVMSIYKNPRLPLKDFFPQLEKLIQIIPENTPAYIMGDFNIDLLKPTKTAKDLINLMCYYRFHQLVERPTHRKGGLLDLMFSNRATPDAVLDIIPTYYSDHSIVSTAIPFASIDSTV